MTDLLNDSMIRAMLFVAILCGLCAIAIYVVSKFRDYNVNDQEGTEQLLANLREMKLKGEITDQEFRTIKASTHVNDDDANEAGDCEPSGSETTSE